MKKMEKKEQARQHKYHIKGVKFSKQNENWVCEEN